MAHASPSTTSSSTSRKRAHSDDDVISRRTTQRSGAATLTPDTAHGPVASTTDTDEDAIANVRALADEQTWEAVRAVVPDIVSQLAHFLVRAQGNNSNGEPTYKVDRFQPRKFPRARGFIAHIAILEDNMAVLQMLVRAHDALTHPEAAHTSPKLRLDDTLSCAIAHGRTAMLQWLVTALPSFADWNWETDLMRTALERCSSSSSSSDLLADAELLEWLYSHCPIMSGALSAHDVARAAGSASLSVVEWLHRHDATYTFTSKAMDAAAASGKLATVQFLHENRTEGCTTDALDSAAAHGHLEVVRFLHTERTEGCTTRAMDNAAKSGHLDVVQFLHEHRTEGCTMQAMDSAASSGHLGVVEYLHANRTEGCSTRAMDGAADNGFTHVLRFLQAHRREGFSPTRVVRWSAKNTTSLELVQFLHANLPPAGWSAAAMDAAAGAGCLDVVQFLHEHRTEDCTTRAMDNAAKAGHLDVVQFLHEQRTEGCSVVALMQAMANGHDDVVKFLYIHRYKDNAPRSL